MSDLEVLGSQLSGRERNRPVHVMREAEAGRLSLTLMAQGRQARATGLRKSSEAAYLLRGLRRCASMCASPEHTSTGASR